MVTFFFTLSGASLLFLVVYDVYATILHARARPGPISETLNRGAWRLARALAFQLPRPRRHRLLNSVGPLLLPALIVIFVVILLTGFGLIYLPHMPAGFRADPEVVSAPFTATLYFSAITLTTVGYGDITPLATTVRLIAVVEAASGFALISLSVTYLLAVYGALERKRVVALSFYHQAEEGADAAGFIAHHFVGGRFVGIEEVLRQAARDIQRLLEAHIEHPVIHYFHPVEVYKSMPRVLFLALEICAVIRACLDEESYEQMRSHPEVLTLDASARHVLSELNSSLRLDTVKGPFGEAAQQEERWRRRFRQTLRRLREAGIETRGDAPEGWVEYRLRREKWESELALFAAYLGYDWDEVTGDSGLDYAADEEMEAPQQDGVQI